LVATPAHTTHSWRFGVFEIDAHTGELFRAGNPIKLRERPFRILVLLLENAGQLVTREELRCLLWPADTFVDFDHSLNVAVMKLREVLGDTAEKPLYIETIPKRGYRFIAPLLPGAEPIITPIAGGASAKSGSLTIYRRIRLVRARISFTVLGVLGVAAVAWFLRPPFPALVVTHFVKITDEGGFKYPVATDGSKLYLVEWVGRGPCEVAVAGGKTAQISIPIPNADLLAASPDGSTLLLGSRIGERRSIWAYQPTAGTLRHLVDSSAVNAAWSPDGASIAYATALGEVMLIGSDGSGGRKLVPGTSAPDTYGVAWSPDGARLRFNRAGKLWEVLADRSGLHEVLPDWRPSWSQFWGRWVLGGKAFVFVPREPRLWTDNSQLWVLDERQGFWRRSRIEPVQLTSGPMRWDRSVISKDGSTIFARGVVPRGELLRFDPAAHQLQPYLGGISADWVTFSPGGNYVAYVTFPEGILWKARSDGGNPVRLTDPPLYPVGIRWSPDASQILFFSGPPDNERAYVISAEGGRARAVLPRESSGQTDPNWSPDGKKIVYSPISFGGHGGYRAMSSDVRIADLETQEVKILPGSATLGSPRWSPDGRFIAALGLGYLQLFDIKKQRWSKLLKGKGINFPMRDQLLKAGPIYGARSGTAEIPVRNYLADILPGLANASVQRLAEITPAAWAAQHALV
jgi:Tol biopolymer transport system component/DNA-binding winged helix-turn-helix (wHTH) protein